MQLDPQQQEQFQHEPQQKQQQQQHMGPGLQASNPWLQTSKSKHHTSPPALASVLVGHHLWRLLLLCRPLTGALLLAALGLSETYVVSLVGAISGHLYQIFVDGDMARLWAVLLQAAGVSAGAAVLSAARSFAVEGLAWRWRGRLTRHVMGLYCGQALCCEVLQVGGGLAA